MRVAIVGAGIAGAYLYARLRNEKDHEITLYERTPREKYRAVCLHPETPIITQSGLRQIKDIEPPERVLTHTGRFKRIKRVTIRNFEGELISVRPYYSSFPVLITPEHPLMARPSWKQPISWRPAGELERNWLLYLPRMASHAGVHPSWWGNHDLLRLAGYYLADGSLSTRRGRTYLYFSKDEEDLARDAAQIVYQMWGSTSSIRRTHNQIYVEIYSERLCHFLMSMGRTAPEKRLPFGFLSANKEGLLALITGLWKGDGCLTKDGMAITTSSPSLAVQIQLMFRSLGLAVSIRKDRPAGETHEILGRTVERKHDSYRVDLDGRSGEFLAMLDLDARKHLPYTWSHARHTPNGLLVPIRKIETIPYSGQVYNLEVEHDESYQLIGMTVHNCAWGTSFKPMKEFAGKAGLNFADYVLHEGKKMNVKLDDRELSIRLKGLVTFDKTKFVLDMAKDCRPVIADVTRNSFPFHKYDLVVEASGLHRRLLPKVKNDLWVPTLEYVIKYREAPYDDFYVEPFPGITGYAWYFPLGAKEGHLGAGDVNRGHIQWLHHETRKNGGEILATVGRPVRLNPSTRVEPIHDGKVVAVGEAAGAIFPAVGEGIIPSLQSVDIMLEHWGDWERYEQALRTKFEVYDKAYKIIESKVKGTFSWSSQLGNFMALYRHLAKNVDRYGMIVGLRDILPLLKI